MMDTSYLSPKNRLARAMQRLLDAHPKRYSASPVEQAEYRKLEAEYADCQRIASLTEPPTPYSWECLLSNTVKDLWGCYGHSRHGRCTLWSVKRLRELRHHMTGFGRVIRLENLVVLPGGVAIEHHSSRGLRYTPSRLSWLIGAVYNLFQHFGLSVTTTI